MKYDVIILGAGGAGLMCAIHAGRRGRKTLILDHSQKIGGKILISGGGRCNFTNTGASASHYVSSNPHFSKSALSRYPSEHFIQMVRKHEIPYHEKKLGQLFCDQSAQDIVQMLQTECSKSGVEWKLGIQILRISQQHIHQQERFQVNILETKEPFTCESLVVATGGLSLPKLGATGLGYEIARQFGLKIIETAPALDGFTFGSPEKESFQELSGVSIDCVISCNGVSFRENLLFTHTGLSGPASLQASLHWRKGDSLRINLLPELDSFQWFLKKKSEGNRSLVKNILAELLPNRFSERFCEHYFNSLLPLAQISERTLAIFCNQLHDWTIIPSGTVGYNKAEVTRGGVDTDELSSKTLEAKKVPGLYFIGEVVDVTGWLGGYNFQWAWASGWAAGQVI